MRNADRHGDLAVAGSKAKGTLRGQQANAGAQAPSVRIDEHRRQPFIARVRPQATSVRRTVVERGPPSLARRLLERPLIRQRDRPNQPVEQNSLPRRGQLQASNAQFPRGDLGQDEVRKHRMTSQITPQHGIQTNANTSGTTSLQERLPRYRSIVTSKPSQPILEQSADSHPQPPQVSSIFNPTRIGDPVANPSDQSRLDRRAPISQTSNQSPHLKTATRGSDQETAVQIDQISRRGRNLQTAQDREAATRRRKTPASPNQPKAGGMFHAGGIARRLKHRPLTL